VKNTFAASWALEMLIRAAFVVKAALLIKGALAIKAAYLVHVL
jgi:hypothetical protein